MAAIRHVLGGLAAGVWMVGMLAGPPGAEAVDPKVEAACSNDYFAHCSKHDPDGPDVRRCMNANGEKLTQQCIDALVAAGEVSEKEVARRSRQSR